MSRYGTQTTLPFSEDMTPRPQDPYGIAKYASELLVENLCKTHGMKYTIVVPHNIIGPRQKYDDPYRNVASIMINRMLQGKSPIIYGDGSQKRCFSFWQDVADPLIKICENDDLDGEVINIGPDEELVTINKVAEICSNVTRTNLQPIYKPSRPKEVKHATCSANFARKLLNYKTTTSLEEGIKKTYEYIKTRGVRPFDYNIDIEIKNELTPKTWTEKEI